MFCGDDVGYSLRVEEIIIGENFGANTTNFVGLFVHL